jgi:hypothetical protein
MKAKEEIEITNFELEGIFRVSKIPLSFYLSNIFCFDCSDNPTKQLIGYRASINNLNDIILDGRCSSCNQIASRYIVTGGVMKTNQVIKTIRAVRSKKTPLH